MIEKARQDLETNIRSSDKSEWTIEAKLTYMSHGGNHEASVTSYVYEIRPKIRGPFDLC